MRGIERKLSIMKQIQAEGQASIAELSDQYQVSSMTIRRDLLKLAEEGLVTLEYGGAVLNTGAMFEYNMPMKECEYRDEKVRIARECASYIKEGDSIFLDAGTTVCELAKAIVNKKNITIMTHSLLVANIFAGLDVNLIMCPGKFRSKSMAYMGQLTDQFLSNFHVDKLFLAVEGVDAEGVSVPNIQDGVTKQNLIKCSKWVACMADSSKFEKSFYYKICDMSQLDLLITDKGLTDDKMKNFEAEVKIIRV